MLDEVIRTAAHEIVPEIGNMLRDAATAESSAMQTERETAELKRALSDTVRFPPPILTDDDYDRMSKHRHDLGYASIPREAVAASPTGYDFDADMPDSWRRDQRICAQAMLRHLCQRVDDQGNLIPITINGTLRTPTDVTLFEFAKEIRGRRQLADRRRQQAERENALAKAESEERKRTDENRSPPSPFSRRFK